MIFKVQGKQIENNSILQENVEITSVVNPGDATSKQYVDSLINQSFVRIINSTSNLNMTALSTTLGSGYMLACSTPIMSVVLSTVSVMINGMEINIGVDASFSGDGGVTFRELGTEVMGDYLYWNTDITRYQLDTSDEIDFTYLTSLSIVPPSIPFMLELTITGTTITIPHSIGYVHNYYINFGDSAEVSHVTSYNDPNCTHTYTIPGVYTVSISGICETFYVNNTGVIVPNITKVLDWGNVGIKVVNFAGCNNLTSIVTDTYSGLTLVTSFSNCFDSCTALTTIPSGLFDYCAGVTSFSNCFDSCASITSIPDGLFSGLTNVTDFSGIFDSCTSLTTIGNGVFDGCVNATNFSWTFGNCTSLTGNAPTLWLDFPTATGTSCFTGDSGLTNWSSIPVPWGGPIPIYTINYGLLYNWYTVSDPREITSSGWVVPSTTDWATLETYLGGDSVAGGKLESTRVAPDTQPRWDSPNSTATNDVGFSAFPGGFRADEPGSTDFAFMGTDAYFWTSTEFNETQSYVRSMFNNDTASYSFNLGKGLGLSIRAMREATELEQLLPDGILSGVYYTGNDGKIYEVTKIGTQVWTTGNLAETKYRNSNDIPIVTLKSDWIILTSGACCAYDNDYSNVPMNPPLDGSTIFKLEIETTGSTQSITLPHLDGYTYNYIVDYGDGTVLPVTSSGDTNTTHVYDTASGYTISISGTCETFYINEDGTLRTTVKKVLSWGNVGLKQVRFAGCNNLTNIVIDSNSGLSLITNFDYIFSNCTSLTLIPTGLFDHCVSGLSFQYSFNNCNNITNIPTGLFDNCTGVTSFYRIFASCGITSIPNNLFDNCTNVITFSGVFYSCSGITSIPTDIFKFNTKVTDFSNAFYFCKSITNIPSGLFDFNTKVTSVVGTFSICEKIQSIPNGLFDNCTGITSLNGTFSNCKSLTAIPNNLFINNTKINSFRQAFQSCTGITTIPTGLFDNCPLVTEFYSTFLGCVSLTAIPTGLFDNCPLVDTFGNIFNGCINIPDIPNNLFDFNTNVIYMFGIFVNCYKLTSIPIGLFDNCTGITNFEGVFKSCTGITSIPTGLFDNCTGVTTFQESFQNCTSLTGLAPTLWLRTPEPLGTNCFSNDTGLTNYSDALSAGWA